MHPADADNQKQQQCFRAYEQGLQAKKTGLAQSQCPYKPGGNSHRRDCRVAWLNGWHCEPAYGPGGANQESVKNVRQMQEDMRQTACHDGPNPD